MADVNDFVIGDRVHWLPDEQVPARIYTVTCVGHESGYLAGSVYDEQGNDIDGIVRPAVEFEKILDPS